MTTIAYKDGIIAYDSLLSDCAGVVIDENFNKKIKISNNSYIFFSGELCCVDKLKEMWIEGIDVCNTQSFSCETIIIQSKKIYRVMLIDGEISREKLNVNKYYAIGHGKQFALTAMDLGLSAKDAVKMAMKRSCFTGGKISTHEMK